MRSIRERVRDMHIEYSATRGKLLSLIAELAKTESYRFDGAADFASWLATELQISIRSARELVRDSEAVCARPALEEALSEGAVTEDQCRALAVLCRAGTDDDEVWLESLPFWSISELEREARKKRAAELERRDGGIYFRMRHTDDERYMRGEFQLHPEDGAAVPSAVEARIPKDTLLRHWDRASALALAQMAKADAGTSATRKPTMIVAVGADTLSGKPGGGAVASLSSGGFVGASTAQRIACDANVKMAYVDQDKITAVSRTSPGVSPGMRQLVEVREHGICAFPCCERDAYLDVHHILPREDGGQTVLVNLLLVCFDHHELLHEGKWSVRGDAGPNMTWVRPDGTIYEPRVRVTLDTS